MRKLLIKKLHEDAVIPKYATEGSVAFDICALEDNILIYGMGVRLIRTGLAVSIPEGYEMNVRARSGLSIKYPNYIAITGGGTIDSDYRGEIKVPIVINNSKSRWDIKKGDRIAQCLIKKVEYVLMEEVDELDETKRGTGGFGSTGK